MCGIAGVIASNPSPPVQQDVLLGMISMISHRGPDEFGLYLNKQVGMGSARLSIIDLSGGQQPISNEDQSLWIVYNGEVFNYPELRGRLQALGHTFTTRTDTEVILHLYEEYGADCLNLLNGQFAIAIWDERNRSLFLARDRLGIRPLYYTQTPQAFVFGSEMKSILAYPGINAEINRDALVETFVFWSPQPPLSTFSNIFQIPPGHFLLYQDEKIHLQPYWSLNFSDRDEPQIPMKVALEELQRLLLDATLIRLRADVPVGAYLSGGLDSSLTTALIRKYSQSRLETFSIAFSDPQYDESAFQKKMAETLGTHHHVVYTTYEDIGRKFPEVLWHTETPILRTAPVPMYLLSDLVHQHGFKVVITGEGADELFGGYDIFKEMIIRRFWARNPESTLRPRLLGTLYPEIAGLSDSARNFFMAFFKMDLTATQSPYYSHMIRWKNGMRLLRFLQPQPAQEWVSLAQRLPLPARFDSWNALSKAQYLEITTFLSSYLLSSQGDRVAMAHSVEGRFPFLDYRVVEFANQLPAEWKLYGLTEKWILRQIARNLLPEEIWKRRKKPYRAPIHKSFYHPNPPDYVTEITSPEFLEETSLFNPLAVNQLFQKASRGIPLSEVEDMAIAGILSTQLIYRQFIQHFPSPQRNQLPLNKIKVIRRNSEGTIL
ncbi:asparagine synthase (glutamine-hydrolyzing) [Anaerolinea thermophila]|uniref:asparagine synthase (glutamine-hydrolyzing) n=3 Tax=Anaerolinea TaxID=233189 RepID=UPI0026ED312E|nr:asparagine synthase (glutamine-hydrolyzing) [Anaerolinea thermophila]